MTFKTNSGSLAIRLRRLQEIVQSDDKFEIAVFIGDEEGITNCSVRRDDCPELPCKQVDCWWKRENPNARTMNVGSDDNDN
jgi:hypothetical protein